MVDGANGVPTNSARATGFEESPIRGRVARILNVKDLVLNRGSSHGVFIGMQFVVLNPIGQDIVDPETNAVIGSVPIAKTIVKVVSLQDELSIARTFRESGGSGLTGITWLMSGPREETLRTTESTAVQELDEKDSYVKTGDEVVEVRDSDEYLLPPI